MASPSERSFDSATTLLRALGSVLLVSSATTLFNIRYLFTATIPLSVAGAIELQAHGRPELQARATSLTIRTVLLPPCDYFAQKSATAAQVAAQNTLQTVTTDTMPGAVPTPYYQEDGRTPFYSDWDPNLKELPVLSFTKSADRAEVDLSKIGDSTL
ncbi:hypothetical protein LTS10_001244 [Elasticomyces elasticus]|nr:hypothetical protein LTS10_001244 [Elasticomyces elasticus]